MGDIKENLATNLHQIAIGMGGETASYNAKFTWYDYSFFTMMLMGGASIGVYYGFYKKQETMKDYLLGGKNMGIIPISMSLVANAVSGISLLALPAEIYRYGVTYWFAYPCMIFVILISYIVYFPVFYKLQITSTFQYLKIRFDTKTRSLGSLLYGILILLYLPIVIYVPALALSQATGLHLHVITWLVCLVCIFYTSIGGLKAVVYCDILQFVLIMGSLITVFSMGVVKGGGFHNIWTTAYENGRLTLSYDLDFTKRDTIWTATIGLIIMWTSSIGISQVNIQRLLALPTRTDAKRAFVALGFGAFLVGTLCIGNGLIVYTYFSDCDPVLYGTMKKHDELIPYYILNVLKIPGLPGLFIAGIFSASLSTLSGGMNGLSGTIFEDFIAPKISKNMTEAKKSKILKLIALAVGVICTVLVTVVEHLGGILALTNSLVGVTSGTTLGLFSVGMLVPMVNSKGAYYGGLTTLTIMAIITGGYQWHQSQGNLVYPILPLSVKACANQSIIFDHLDNQRTAHNGISEDVFVLFTVSFFWYTALGLIIFILTSVIISYFTSTGKVVSRDLLSPIIYRFLSIDYMTSPPTYTSIDKALIVIENRQ